MLLQSCAVCCAFLLGQDVPQYETKCRGAYYNEAREREARDVSDGMAVLHITAYHGISAGRDGKTAIKMAPPSRPVRFRR